MEKASKEGLELPLALPEVDDPRDRCGKRRIGAAPADARPTLAPAQAPS